MTLQKRIWEIEERLDYFYELDKQHNFEEFSQEEIDNELINLEEELESIYRKIDMKIY